ncbi:MAG: nucleotidyltransferase family protein [Candidatus Anstonellales archaeon]
MKCFVLCGGEGTRLRPYTYMLPKSMLPVGNKPILEYVVRNLIKNGLDELVFTVGYKYEPIKEYFGNGKKFGVKIEYLIEEKPRNTAGSILPYKNKIDGDFVVVMGDQLTNMNIRKMIESHKKTGALATVAFVEQKKILEYGVGKVENGRVVEFVEKPIFTNYINTANYVFSKEAFRYINENEDFAKDVLPRMLKSKERINAFISTDFWMDIGRVQDYERANELFSAINFARDIEQ